VRWRLPEGNPDETPAFHPLPHLTSERISVLHDFADRSARGKEGALAIAIGQAAAAGFTSLGVALGQIGP
jgi:hypothetical protein